MRQRRQAVSRRAWRRSRRPAQRTLHASALRRSARESPSSAHGWRRVRSQSQARRQTRDLTPLPRQGLGRLLSGPLRRAGATRLRLRGLCQAPLQMRLPGRRRPPAAWGAGRGTHLLHHFWGTSMHRRQQEVLRLPWSRDPRQLRQRRLCTRERLGLPAGRAMSAAGEVQA